MVLALKCRWCGRDLNTCVEGDAADVTRVPQLVLRAWRMLGPYPRRLELCWVDRLRERRRVKS